MDDVLYTRGDTDTYAFVCRDGLTSSQYFIQVLVYRISRRFFLAFILPKLFNKLQRPIACARERAIYVYIYYTTYNTASAAGDRVDTKRARIINATVDFYSRF